MTNYFHKIAAYTAVTFISAQTVSIGLSALEKSPYPMLSLADDDNLTVKHTPKLHTDPTQQMGKVSGFLAWVNIDLEADLH